MRYGRILKAVMLAVISAAMLAGGAGCVAQAEYDRIETLYRRGQEQIADLQARLEEANARIRALQEAGRTPDADLLAKLEQAIADRNRLQKALADAEDRLRRAGQVGPVLEPELDAALKELAASDPDLMTYDPLHGMVRFKSDMTFPLGSTEVSDKAAKSLGRLAEILKRPVAQKYQTEIIGHTDNVRIGKPETRAKHPTNWHLSVHRSIAVKDVLEQSGVAPVRMQVAGYGEWRPVVSNGAKGAEANRRVEIFLTPNTYTGPGNTPAAVEAPAARPAAPKAPAARPAPKAPVDGPPEAFK